MPGGRKNPISMTGFVEMVADAVNTATGNAHDLAKFEVRGVGELVDLISKVNG